MRLNDQINLNLMTQSFVRHYNQIPVSVIEKSICVINYEAAGKLRYLYNNLLPTLTLVSQVSERRSLLARCILPWTQST
jgi:hypothetical protein